MSHKSLDRLFSKYIRLRDLIHIGRCITCGAKISSISQIECGHYISRRYMSLRWHPLNAHGQCRRCNQVLYGNLEAYKRFLESRYGIGILDRLNALRNVLCKPDKVWMRRYRSILRSRIEHLEKNLRRYRLRYRKK